MILLDHGDLSEILKWATHQKKLVSTFIYPESFFRLTPQFLEKERASQSVELPVAAPSLKGLY